MSLTNKISEIVTNPFKPNEQMSHDLFHTKTQKKERRRKLVKSKLENKWLREKLRYPDGLKAKKSIHAKLGK